MIVERVTIEGECITVPLIVWRRFHRPMPGLLEQILALNPGLGERGTVLPLGTTFDMPVPAPREPAVLDPIRLW